MTTVLIEPEIDWGPFEEMLDWQPCYDCDEKAVWLQTINCCKASQPKCDMHKRMMEALMRRVELCTSVKWNCAECGATGLAIPGIRVWELVSWEPL